MKQTYFLFLILLCLLLASFATAQALYPEMYGFYGQNQYYYVVFDGEGEASVLARIEFQNTENLSEFAFKIPGEDITIINMAQEYYAYEKECLEWEELSCTTTETGETCIKKCKSDTSYPIYPPKYAQVSYSIGEAEGMTNVHFTIPHQDQETLSIIAYYKTAEYVTKEQGIFHYTFLTIQDAYDTGFVRVSIDVAENLYLEGLQSAIDYQKELFAENTDLARIASSLPYVDTGYTETAAALDPSESFRVEGRYAKSWWTVHWWKVLSGMLLALTVLMGIIYGIRRIAQKHKKLGLPLLVGLTSGIFVFLLWFTCFYMTENWYVFGFYNDILFLFVILLTILMSLFFLFIPAFYIGYTDGVKYALLCFIATVITLFILGVVAILVVFFLNLGPVPSVIY